MDISATLEVVQQREKTGEIIGCWSDIPIGVYHNDLCPGYSSTTLKRILKESFNHWYEGKSKQSEALEFGSAFHLWVSEPEAFRDECIIMHVESKKEAQWQQAKKSKGSKLLITGQEFDAIRRMTDKVMSHPDAAPLVTSSHKELSFFSRDKETGLLKKARVDLINGHAISDLKSTTSASKDEFERDARKYLYRISAAYYLEVVNEVWPTKSYRDFYLIACEKEPPFEVAVYRIDDRSIAAGIEDVRAALRKIKTYLDKGPAAWGGYDLGIREVLI